MEKRESKNVYDMMFRSTRERNGNTFWTACAGMLITLLPYFKKRKYWFNKRG